MVEATVLLHDDDNVLNRPGTEDTGPPVTGTVLMGEVFTGAVLTVGATPEPHPADKSDKSRKTLLPRRCSSKHTRKNLWPDGSFLPSGHEFW